MATLHSKLEQHLACSVCLEKLSNPKALPCLHSFCHNCLLKIIKNGKITCPECRKSLEISNPPDISFLPSNFIVNNILETMSGGDKHIEKEDPICGSCDTGCSAGYHCGACSLLLCRLCSEAHMLSESTRTHVILPLDEIDATGGSLADTEQNVVNLPGCSKHNAALDVFCLSCQTAICEVCVEKTHDGHKCLPLVEVAPKEKGEICDLLDKMKKEKIKLSNNVSFVRSKEEELIARKETVVSEIIGYFDNLSQLLERRKKELVDQATSLFCGRQKELVGPQESLEMSLTRCDNVIETAEAIFERGNDAEILNQKVGIVECLNSMGQCLEEKMPLPDDSTEFFTKYSAQEIDEKILQHCYVLKEVASPECCTASFKDPKAVLQVGKTSVVTVVCRNKSNQAMTNGGQLVTPIFTGVKVKNVSVSDNNNGSYDTKFTAQEVGAVKFQALINGHPAQRCCFTRKVTWALRENIGTGLLSDGGLTFSGDRAFGNWCFRVGQCCFETGVHSWKVEIKYSGGSRLSFKKEVEVGVIDFDGDLSHGAVKNGHTRKWSARSSAEVIALVKLDMDHHVLSVQFTGGVDERNRSTAPSQNSFDITANRVCPYFALQGKHLSLAVKQP